MSLPTKLPPSSLRQLKSPFVSAEISHIDADMCQIAVESRGGYTGLLRCSPSDIRDVFDVLCDSHDVGFIDSDGEIAFYRDSRFLHGKTLIDESGRVYDLEELLERYND